jgi:hypothetical protein
MMVAACSCHTSCAARLLVLPGLLFDVYGSVCHLSQHSVLCSAENQFRVVLLAKDRRSL